MFNGNRGCIWSYKYLINLTAPDVLPIYSEPYIYDPSARKFENIFIKKYYKGSIEQSKT